MIQRLFNQSVIMERPLLVSDCYKNCVPESLEKVILCLEHHVAIPTSNQLLAALFFVLMQECGYYLHQPTEHESVSEDLTGSDQRTSTFNLSRVLSQAPLVAPLLIPKDGVFKIPFRLDGVDYYKFHFLMSVSAEDLVIVNLLISKENFTECFSIALRVSTFVPNPKNDNVAQKFHDLTTLSFIFKDNIAHKGRTIVLNAEGIVNNSLVGLMSEVKQKIAHVLSVKDILNLSATCHNMLLVIRDPYVWRALLWRDFNYKVPLGEEMSAVDLMKKYQKLCPSKPAVRKQYSVLLEDDMNVSDFSFDLNFIDSESQRFM